MLKERLTAREIPDHGGNHVRLIWQNVDRLGEQHSLAAESSIFASGTFVTCFNQLPPTTSAWSMPTRVTNSAWSSACRNLDRLL